MSVSTIKNLEKQVYCYDTKPQRRIFEVLKSQGMQMNQPPVHAHILRHGTGYYLANRGTDTRTIQSYLGHKNIQHTVRYTELASTKFQGLWDD